MKYESIYRFLENKIGLDINSINEGIASSAIERIMNESGVTNENQLLNQISNSNNHFQRLISELLDSETWFFRDKESFDFFMDEVHEIKKISSSGMKLRILSLACSTGEEAYSIAISLLESGFKYDEFEIIAFDINTASIETAEQGIYSSDSFKEMNSELIKKYFYQAEDIFIINPNLGNLITFRSDNILTFKLEHNLIKFDYIFFRNILTNFSVQAKIKAIQNIKSLLKHNGIVFTAIDEISVFIDNGFVSIGNSDIPAFRFQTDESHHEEIKPRKKGFKDRFVKIHTSLKINPKSQISSEFESNIFSNNVNSIERIQKLIDSKKYQSALDYCIDYNANNVNDPNGYYLLGIIYEQLKILDKAEEFFHKALYLEPYHYETLIHLVLIFENKGWNDRASMLKRRLDRITGKI
jgi:chemotaxis protein methyltransferase WspC